VNFDIEAPVRFISGPEARNELLSTVVDRILGTPCEPTDLLDIEVPGVLRCPKDRFWIFTGPFLQKNSLEFNWEILDKLRFGVKYNRAVIRGSMMVMVSVCLMACENGKS
jgi:hypothetical protein